MARLEAAWPLLALAAGTGAVIAIEAMLLAALWTSDAPVYYALP